MRSLISNKQFSNLSNRQEAEKTEEEEEEEYDDGDNAISVTTHLYLKPPHSTERLDKEVVLRRIRHRKRVCKVKSSAAQVLLNSKPHASKSAADHNKSNSTPLIIKWADDAFAAP